MSSLLADGVEGSRGEGLAARSSRALVKAGPDPWVRACASVATHPSSVALAEVLAPPACWPG